MGCALRGGHDEELYRDMENHRKMLWICPRCKTLTRQMKLSAREDKEMRKLQKKLKGARVIDQKVVAIKN